MKKLFISSIIGLFCLYPFYGCSNNIFYPKADITITKIKSSDDKTPISIKQKWTAIENKIPLVEYTFYNPLVTLENRPGLPKVTFKEAIVTYTIEGKQLPKKLIKLENIVVPINTKVETTISILDYDSDLKNIVYPGNSVAKVNEASADVLLIGKDDNGYEITVPFTFNIKFATDLTEIKNPEIISMIM